MGVFTRVIDLVNSNVNSLLDNLEKPDQLLKLAIQDMEEALVDVRSEAAQFIAKEKQLTRQKTTLLDQQQDWLEKAEIALSKDRDDLAKQALMSKNSLAAELTSVEEQLAHIQDTLTKIKDDANKLNEKLVQAKKQLKVFEQKQRTATVQLDAKRAQKEYDAIEAEQRYQQLHEKVDRLESEVESFDMCSNPSLAQQFQELEQQQKLDDELAELRNKVAKKSQSKEQ